MACGALVAGGVLAGIPAAGILGTSAPAHASIKDLGIVVVYPGTGLDVTPMKMVTSAGCPAPSDAYYATATGHGFPADNVLTIVGTTSAGISRQGRFYVEFEQTMADFAQRGNTTLTGQYDLVVYCVDQATSTTHGRFTGSIEFTSPTTYQALGTARPPVGGALPEPGQPYRPPVSPVAGKASTKPTAVTSTSSTPSSQGFTYWPVVVIVFVIVVIAAFLYGRRTSRL